MEVSHWGPVAKPQLGDLGDLAVYRHCLPILAEKQSKLENLDWKILHNSPFDSLPVCLTVWG